MNLDSKSDENMLHTNAQIGETHFLSSLFLPFTPCSFHAGPNDCFVEKIAHLLKMIMTAHSVNVKSKITMQRQIELAC